MTTRAPPPSATAAPFRDRPRLRPLAGAALIVAATLVAYLPTLSAGFIWDDDAHITAPALRSLQGLWRIWTDVGATQQYYPLLHSFFWIEWHAWGPAPLGYHLVNVALHAVNAVLVWMLLRRLGVPGAMLAALVFALHPVEVESVAWISEQKNTLSGLFYLASALAYLRFDDERATGARTGAGRYALATALFVAALATKTVTATLPVALLIVAWWRRGRVAWRRDFTPLAPWVILGAGAGLVTATIERTVIGAEGPAFALSTAQRVIVAGRALWFYLGKLAWPAPLAFIYPRWTLDPAQAWQWLPLLAAIGTLVVAWRIRDRSRTPLAAALFFGATLFPALGFFNVYPFLYSYTADHFQYLASVGPIALVAGVAAGRWPRRRRALAPLTAGLVLAGLGVATFHQARIYHDADTLYRTTLAENPTCWMAENNLGQEWMGRPGRLPDAIALFERALRHRPEYAEAENNLGLALTEAKRSREAIPHLEHAIALKPNFYQAYNNLGIALAMSGEPARAADAFARAAALNPKLANLEENWAKALVLLGHPAEAAAHFARAAALRAGQVQ